LISVPLHFPKVLTAVIARSASDEAIQSAFAALDCFASLAMTGMMTLVIVCVAQDNGTMTAQTATEFP
jgi:hypothetical protein